MSQTFTGQLGKAQLWHQRLCHISFQTIKKLFGANIKACFCPACALAKSHKQPLTGLGSKVTRVLEVVHSDVCGPFSKATPEGHKYFVLFIDQYSRFTFCFLLKTKDEVHDKFKIVMNHLQNLHGKYPDVIHHDGGGEYINKPMEDWCSENGVRRSSTAPHSSGQNGIAERKNRTIQEAARAMLTQAGLPLTYWGKAVLYANYIQNRIPTTTLDNHSPLQLWATTDTDVSKSLSHIRTFGCLAYAHVYSKRKGNNKARQCLFLGMDPVKQGYLLMLPNRQLITCRDVTFNV
jgi:hypothetical protein